MPVHYEDSFIPGMGGQVGQVRGGGQVGHTGQVTVGGQGAEVGQVGHTGH